MIWHSFWSMIHNIGKKQASDPKYQINHHCVMKKLKVFPAIFLVLLSIAHLHAQEPTFQDFLDQFPKATLPYTFDAVELQDQIETRPTAKIKRLGWEFYQFLPELERSAQFSSKPVHPEPVAVFQTDEFYAVLYNVARGLTRGTKTYSISVFEKDGAYVGTHFVAGVNAEYLTVATIDEQLKASVLEYQISWENEFRYNGAPNNKVSGLILKDTQTLELTAPGNPDPIEWTARMTPEQVEISADIAKMK